MGHLRTQIWSTCQNIKKFKVVSRFLLWKKSFWRIIALQKSFCQKWLSRKKVRLQQWKKISVAFCKKDWIWDNNNLCVAKKIAITKKTTKRQKCLEYPFLLEKKNAMQPKLVGCREFILVYCFLVCLKESRKYYWEALSSKLHPIVKIYAFSPNRFSFLSFSFNCWT